MPKSPLPTTRPPPIIEFGWLKKEFDELHREHTLILKRIDELEKAMDKIPILVTPELEAQVKKVSAIAIKIDRKVPDKNVPPGTKP